MSKETAVKLIGTQILSINSKGLQKKKRLIINSSKSQTQGVTFLHSKNIYILFHAGDQHESILILDNVDNK